MRNGEAEDVYTTLVEKQVGFAPGWVGRLEVTFAEYGRHSCRAEVRPNAIWRFGRVFLRCERCGGRCTRLYLSPVEHSWLACRQCWGLTYASSRLRNYKDRGPWFAHELGLTHRFAAAMEAYHARERRREDSRARNERRRRCLQARAMSD